ncbi:MAG TPA: hypothetical protein VM056_00755 [Terriglobales bacterium]|nr:hypothetical protein [Terriglobales bacterium]
MDPLHIWKQLSDDLRTQSAEAFFDDSTLKDFHRAAEAFIARQKNFRPAFIKRLPQSKRAFYLAHLPLSPELASQLLVSYHFAQQRPLMSVFLNALNIPNDNGLITSDAEVSKPDDQLLTTAIDTLRRDFPSDDVTRYFATLYSQNPEVWSGLESQVAVSNAE